MVEFRMPSLGADMDKGRVTEWRIKPGDEVHRGDIVAVVETDKADIEVESFEPGVVEELVVAEGEQVSVGTVLARFRPIGGPPAVEVPPVAAEVPPVVEVAPPAPAVEVPRVVEAPPAPAVEVPPAVRPAAVVTSPVVRRLAAQLGVDLGGVAGTGPGGVVTRRDVEAATGRRVEARRPLTPRARRQAQALGVDLAAVSGTGPGGAVTGGDVIRAAAAPPPAVTAPVQPAAVGPVAPVAPTAGPAPSRAAGVKEDRLVTMRAAVADLMARSKREIPHYYLSTTIELGTAMAWLEEQNAGRAPAARLLPAALLLKATARAALDVPEMNGYWVDGQFRGEDHVHLGVAVSLRQGGLLAPAIRDADGLSLDELMDRLRDLVTRTRAGSLRSSEMSAPTITVTNLGDQGAEAVYGVIYPPQVALVGFGRIAERPWAAGGMVGVRPAVTATLAGDHRASDGHRGGRFLNLIDRLLQDPGAL